MCCPSTSGSTTRARRRSGCTTGLLAIPCRTTSGSFLLAPWRSASTGSSRFMTRAFRAKRFRSRRTSSSGSISRSGPALSSTSWRRTISRCGLIRPSSSTRTGSASAWPRSTSSAFSRTSSIKRRTCTGAPTPISDTPRVARASRGSVSSRRCRARSSTLTRRSSRSSSPTRRTSIWSSQTAPRQSSTS
eukprot:Amastigsp_a676496_131.p4 type:complete len:189 gc:universal Amastigsp_a676496_131:479-1045(+)